MRSRRAWFSWTSSPVDGAARVVPGVDDLGLDLDRGPVDVGRDVELADVEPQVVEAFDAGRDTPPLVGRERLGVRQGVPELVVPRDERVAHEDLVDVLVEQLTRGEVHELADDVGPGEVHVVAALARAQLAVQVTRLRVDEVGREGLGVASEERVGQRHVAPVEADEVQAHEQHGEGVDEPGRGVRLECLAEERAVGQRELQVLGDEHGLEALAVRVRAARDDPHGHDARHVHAAELAQELVLAVGDGLADLLDRDDAPGHAHEAHDVAGDTAGKGCEHLVGPLLERDVPGEVEQGWVGG